MNYLLEPYLFDAVVAERIFREGLPAQKKPAASAAGCKHIDRGKAYCTVNEITGVPLLVTPPPVPFTVTL